MRSVERVSVFQRPKRIRAMRFGFCVLSFALFPKQLAYQDLGALIARQSAVSEHWRQHVFATAPFGSVAAASFGIGALMPSPLRAQYASLDLRSLQLEGSRAVPVPAPLDFPVVNRAAKGDRLPVSPPVAQEGTHESADDIQEKTQVTSHDAAQDAAQNIVQDAARMLPQDSIAEASPYAIPEADFGVAAMPEVAARASFEPFPAIDLSLSLDLAPPASKAASTPAHTEMATPAASGDARATKPVGDTASQAVDDAAIAVSDIFFRAAPIGEELGRIERWQPGEVPIFAPPAAFADPDIKRSAQNSPVFASLPLAKVDPAPVTVAPKGVVAANPQRLKSPAERLKLSSAQRTKAEKCLANAVYFEARGESERGQEAVAQVVMNRVFSEFYPNDVCGVVYQNSHRHLACQFTFACDNVRDVVREPKLYEQAKRIARDTLDGKIWIAEVGKATHYHAYWVHPNWVREMRKLKRIGVHTFYRPRNWGNGADEPHWGDTSTPTKARL